MEARPPRPKILGMEPIIYMSRHKMGWKMNRRPFRGLGGDRHHGPGPSWVTLEVPGDDTYSSGGIGFCGELRRGRGGDRGIPRLTLTVGADTYYANYYPSEKFR